MDTLITALAEADSAIAIVNWRETIHLVLLHFLFTLSQSHAVTLCIKGK
jgi:hypothetical protein